MSKFLTCTIMLGVLAASPVAAKPQTRAEKIAEAKASIEGGADEFAITIWQEKPAWVDELQISVDYNRRLGRWLASGSAIGACERYANPTLIADWISKIDGFARALPGALTESRDFIETAGMRFRRSGQRNSIDSSVENEDLPPSFARDFCDIELEAVRQILQTL